MRDQPPGDNNPSNPLFKVASLNVSKEINKDRNLYLNCTLGFKKSSHIGGKHRNIHGDVIQTVSFHLSIKRAVLTVEFKTPEIEDFKIESIAHSSRGYKIGKSQTKTIREANRIDELKGRLGLALGGELKEISANADIGRSRSKGNATSSQYSNVSTATKISVAGTFDPDTVHWEIQPNTVSQDSQHLEYIEGEIFDVERGGDRLKACMASWVSGSGVYIEAKSSVWVHIKDLSISNVQIFDMDGEEKRLPEGIQISVSSRQLKLKFVKQLIKNHLARQGLGIDGAYLEVCRAYA